MFLLDITYVISVMFWDIKEEWEYNMKQLYIQQKGFTLIEMLVATAIFMSIMLMAMGSLVVSSNAAKKAQALHSSMENVNFAVASMARSLRTGSQYVCRTGTADYSFDGVTPYHLIDSANPNCPLSSNTPGDIVVFVPSIDKTNPPTSGVAFMKVDRGDGTSTLQRCNLDNDCVDIVSSDVDVQDLKFFVQGASTDDGIQSSVYILMKGVVTIKNEATPFAIQTMVSQRSAE